MSVCLCFLVPRHALSLVIFFVCFGSYRMCHSHRGLPYPVFVRYLAILYNTKSVKFTCSSRSSRASQSPYTVEKQPKSTPDMYNPTHPIMGRGAHVYIPSWTFIAVVTTVYECCEDSDESRSTFLSRSKARTIITINAFYVTAFLRCRSQRSLFYVSGVGRSGSLQKIVMSHPISSFWSCAIQKE